MGYFFVRVLLDQPFTRRKGWRKEYSDDELEVVFEAEVREKQKSHGNLRPIEFFVSLFHGFFSWRNGLQHSVFDVYVYDMYTRSRCE